MMAVTVPKKGKIIKQKISLATLILFLFDIFLRETNKKDWEASITKC